MSNDANSASQHSTARWRFPNPWRWAVGSLGLLFIVYVLAGFYLVPGLIRLEATQWVKTNLDKPLGLGTIKFNPLTLTLDMDDIALPQAQTGTQSPIVAIGHLHLGFSALSLFQSAYRFTDVTLDRPFVRAVMRPDGSLNLIELQPRTHSSGPSPAVKISTFTVNQGRIIYADESQAQRVEQSLIPIAFTLRDFQTNLAKGGDFTFNAKSQRGEVIAWHGTLSIAPISSRGRLTIDALQSATVRDMLGGRLPVALTGGQLSMTADYDFAYGPQGLALNLSLPRIAASGLAVTGGPASFRGAAAVAKLDASVGSLVLTANGHGIARLTAAMPKLTVEGLSVTTADAAAPTLQLATLSLADSELDFAARKLTLGNLMLGGANLSLQRQRDGQISLVNLLPAKTPAPAPAGAAPAQPWQIVLGPFALQDGQLHFEDLTLQHPVRLDMAPLAISATGAGSDLTQPVSVHFDAGLNGKGHTDGDAVVTPANLTGDIKFVLTGLNVTPFAPYLPQLKALELRSGEAGASGTVHFEGANLGALRFSGNAAIGNFSMLEAETKSPLFGWQSFALRGIDLRDSRIVIARASLVRPVGQVVVLPDRSFNFTPLMPPKAAAASAVPIKAAPAQSAWAVQMKQLDISGGSMGFSDMSIQPNFSARIDALKGTIGNISNAPRQIVAIDLSGQVIDQFSPVTIKGAMDLTEYDRKTDMQLAFRNIELPVFNPYSGHYAGYAIAKGKLTTELSYKIENRALKADHHVIIDQLEWGQATDSKDAVPLPLRLATSLLKDKNGTIDLDLPVTGSLDDPKFSIWPVIWQVVGNVIEKAVTAPFRLIGSLFEGADKAQYIDFAPGSAGLPQGSADSLGALAKALNQRPELKLDIPAGPGIREDATAMADAAIDQALLANTKGKITSVAALDPDDTHDWLEDIYRAKLGKKAAFPEFPPDALKAAPGAKPDADDDDRRTLLESQWMRNELRASFTPGNAELAALGTARAIAVRNALLADGSVDPGRVFMATELAGAINDGQARIELKFE